MSRYPESSCFAAIRLRLLIAVTAVALGLALAACSPNGMSDKSDDEEEKTESGSYGGGY